ASSSTLFCPFFNVQRSWTLAPSPRWALLPGHWWTLLPSFLDPPLWPLVDPPPFFFGPSSLAVGGPSLPFWTLLSGRWWTPPSFLFGPSSLAIGGPSSLSSFVVPSSLALWWSLLH
ncbi:hypothetical protein C8R48DRAFT_838156, partial [Suillus tomentosus]